MAKFFIHPTAIVETDSIGENTNIHPFAIIKEGVKIGKNVEIHPNVIIESGVNIGDGVEVFPGSYIGKIPKGSGAISRTPKYEKIINIGENCSIGPNAVIFFDVSIDNNTLIGDGASIRENCRVGSECIISRYVTINYNTQIGNKTKIMDLSHITGNCQIGNEVFISTGVVTSNDNKMGKNPYSETHIIGPIIEDKASIGANASILPGIKVGYSSIVGSGAVVTKNVEQFSLVMGVPARLVKHLPRI